MDKTFINKHEDSRLLPEERRRRIAERLQSTGSVTIAQLEGDFGISQMTARRDLAILEREGRARRTHGGAVLPELAGHEDSFRQRVEQATAAKHALATAAANLVEPGESLFLDSSSTSFFVAQELRSRGVSASVITNSIPILDLLSGPEAPSIEVISSGGLVRKLTLSFVGPHSIDAISRHFADKCFLSVKGLMRDGHLVDPDLLEAEVKRTMVKQADRPVLLVDASKFGHKGLHSIAHVSDVSLVLVAEAAEQSLQWLEVSGVEVRRVS
ncbi:MAG: DeoR/GlpR family DNA-binding transcription regulator [Actinomycetota bacterium]